MTLRDPKMPLPCVDRRTGSERRCSISAQTPPTGTGEIVLDSVIAMIDRWMHNPSGEKRRGLPAVREDLIARAEIGEKKYGTKLRVRNGRRAIVDLYQELLDALMYSMQAKMEGDVEAGNYVELLLAISAQVAAELDKR